MLSQPYFLGYLLSTFITAAQQSMFYYNINNCGGCKNQATWFRTQFDFPIIVMLYFKYPVSFLYKSIVIFTVNQVLIHVYYTGT